MAQIRVKSSGDLKYYLYISNSKLEMLYQQVASSDKTKKSLEWSVDLKAVKLTHKMETEDEPGTNDKLRVVLREISAWRMSEMVPLW